jgi:hypothetical protein
VGVNISVGVLDKLIAGKGSAPGPEGAELARILARVNSAYVGPIPAAEESKHLAAIQQANRSRPASTAPAAASTGPGSVLEPFKSFAAGFRRTGWAHLSGATAVWAVVVALLMVSATGGLAAAGVLPDSLQSAVSSAAASVGINVPMPETSVTVADPAGSGGTNVTQDSLAAQQAALASAERAVQEAEQAQKAAQEAAATSARCIEESMAQVSTLVDGILSATSPAQAQALVTQAGSLGGGVKACADQATNLGQAGVSHAGEATRLAQEASGAQAVASDQVKAAIDAANNAARTAGTSSTRALDMSRSIIGNVSTLAAGLINSSLGLQETLISTDATAPAAGAPAAVAPRPPANITDPSAWTAWGMDYANQIMSSFMGGTRPRR